MTMLQRVVVAGGGIAALTACDTLRAEGFDGEIALVGSEPHAAYSRPALSKGLLTPDADLTAHELPAASHGAREVCGVEVTGLDAGRRRVRLSDGSELPYDGLVVATGSRARRLTNSAAERTLRELADAVALRESFARAQSVIVVGGGVLGGEVASGALAAGCAVTMVATSPPMSRQLGAYLSGVVAAAAEAQGLHLVQAAEVRVHTQGDGIVVRADGVRLEAEIVVTAVGDLPNLQWLVEAGLVRQGALLADDRGRVAPGIVAAGDVATWTGARGSRRMPLWTSAIEQAKVAARALVHGDAADPLSFQPYFWTEQFGLHIKALGDLPLMGAPEVVVEGVEKGEGLLRWAHADGSLTAVAVNHRIPIPRLRRLTHVETDTVG